MKSDAPRLKIWLPAIKTGSGSDVYTMRLAHGLSAAGHIPVLQFFDRRFELAPWLLGKITPPPGTQVIHTNSWNGYAFKRDKIPLVVTEHHYIGDPAFHSFRHPAQAIYHRLHILPGVHRSYAAANALIAVSHHTASAIKQQRGIHASCIHNWIDTTQFQPTHSPTQHTGPLRCLFVGNPARRKGSDILPALAKSLPPGIQIHCLGGLRGNIKTAAGTRQIIPVSRLAPEQMPVLYQQMHVALIPTRYEAFGYVALEAMACGLPVVGFDSTGTAEVCIHGETALLTPTDDLDALIGNLIKLQKDPSLRMQLGRNGRAHAISNFSSEAAIQAYVDTYYRVLGR